MQIVIDIPKEIVTDIKDYCGMSIADAKEALPIILNAIHNGIPIPKGHGAIKDVSQIEIPMCEDRAYERWVQIAIDSAPTIIEADREVEDGND